MGIFCILRFYNESDFCGFIDITNLVDSYFLLRGIFLKMTKRISDIKNRISGITS